MPDEHSGGIDLGGLLGGLFSSSGGAEAESDSGEPGLAGLPGALLGGGDTVDLGAVTAESGAAQGKLQAIVPLIAPLLAGALLGEASGEGGAAGEGVSRAALENLVQGKAGAADALSGTGLLQEVMRRTGLNRSGALAVIIAVLKALGLGKAGASGKPKPKPKPKPNAKPKPKPKAHHERTASKPKPKPKPSSHTTSAKPKPKPKPKPGSHAAATKPRPKPRPKRSGAVDEGGSLPDESGA